MKKFLLLLVLIFAFTARVTATDIDIGATTITGLNTANAGADTALSGVVVNLASASVTCSSCMPTGAVGIGGMQITFSTGIRYTIATVTTRSAFTLTVNYAESSGTVTATLHKFVHLRIYALRSFVPSGSSVVIQSGAPGSTAWYRRYGVSIVNDGVQNIAYVPQIDDLPATTDSSVPTARYYAAIYTQSGGLMQIYPGCVDEWRLDSTISLTSWAQICTFNATPTTPPNNPTTYLSEAQINARFPTCTINRLIYYAATGNVQSCLNFSNEFSISGGILSLAAPATGYNRIQEEGSNLPQRTTLNFIGSAFTAADNVGNTRTELSADADLNALASNATNGFWAAGTNLARTLTGTSNEITITNGNGTVGNPVWSLPSALTFTGKTVTGGSFTAGAVSALTSFGIRSSGAPFDLQINNTEALTANRTLTFTLNDANRVVNLAGNFTTSGANPLTFTTTGSTNVTLPTGGTLAQNGNNLSFFSSTTSAQLAGVISDETGSGALVFGTSPKILTSILDTNGNEVATLNATASAVNEVSITNAATGTGPTIAVSGGDSNADLNVNGKGTGRVIIKGYPYTVDVDTSTVGNVGGGQDNLHSYTLPINSLATNGDYLEGNASGNFTANDNDKNVQFSVGGSLVVTMGAADIDGAVGWNIAFGVVRLSTTSVLAWAKITCNALGVDSTSAVISTFTKGFYTESDNKTITGLASLASNTLLLQFTGQGVADNDVTQNLTIVKLIQR